MKQPQQPEQIKHAKYMGSIYRVSLCRKHACKRQKFADIGYAVKLVRGSKSCFECKKSVKENKFALKKEPKSYSENSIQHLSKYTEAHKSFEEC